MPNRKVGHVLVADVVEVAVTGSGQRSIVPGAGGKGCSASDGVWEIGHNDI